MLRMLIPVDGSECALHAVKRAIRFKNETQGAPERRASPELAAAIEVLAEAGGRQSDPTLAELRAVLQEATWSVDGELLFPQDRTALVIELDELIDALGSDTSAAALINRKPE